MYNVKSPAFGDTDYPGWWQSPLYAAAGAVEVYQGPLVLSAPPPPPLLAVPDLRNSSSANLSVPPQSMGNIIMLADMDSSSDAKQAFKQGTQLPDSEQWVETCATEVASLLDHRVNGVNRSTEG